LSDFPRDQFFRCHHLVLSEENVCERGQQDAKEDGSQIDRHIASDIIVHWIDPLVSNPCG